MNKQGQRSMKIAIKMFLGFGWIETRRSKIAKIRVFRGDDFYFSCKKIEEQCKLDVRVNTCNFLVFGIFSFFPIFSAQTFLFLNPK